MDLVIPAAPGSPWLEACVAAARADGAGRIVVVSEAPGPEGTEHVAVGADAGFAARANAGIAAASSARVLLLNDDTELQRGALAALAEAPPVAGAVLLNWDDDSVQQAGIRVSRSGRVRAVTAGDADSVEAVSGAAMALDVDVWDRLGGFEERFGFYMEDIDFCLRAGGAAVVAEARVRHRGGGTRSPRSPEAAFHLGRSHALLARRMGGGTLATAARTLYVGALGTAWTARRVGPAGLPRFTRGWFAGLGA